ncbi:tyrosine-type recombinase/integrase [Candidatus Palauibacter sp.]|uniref:tyrosine-type recombinase/integrase n=1 Tax=Candidatus Palauibacter sp. TaxID=3101350 RepID=UPI003B01D279
MFEALFIDRDTIARYRRAPLLEERLSYLKHCAREGARPLTLRTVAAAQIALIHLLDLREGERVSLPRIEAAADRRSSRPAQPTARRNFVSRAVRWLRFAGLLDEPCGVRPRHAQVAEVAVFREWMRNERGWSESTICNCCNTIDHFFDWLGEWDIALDAVVVADIDRAVVRWHARGCSRSTIRMYGHRLRPFFRFAERRGWCSHGLADGIMPVRFHPAEALPKGLNRDEVLRLLATSEGSRPAALRDRAILMVLIAYGLRAGEVAGLRLDDLDWANETLRVRHPKPGCTHHYPLSRGVGQAIVRYLTEARPPRPERALFLTLIAPIRPVTRQAVSNVVRTRLDRLGITGKRRGAHALRHAVAQRLLDHGLSFKEVGDYLGHRCTSSTAVYAKVQLSTLREVADIDLEGLA